MDRKETEGKGYICLVRASDSPDETSTEAQLKMLCDFGERMGMIYVDKCAFGKLTGSLPGRRKDLRGLLERKREKNDFDVILVQRLDRLTRGGSAHGFWFEHECSCAGIRLLFVGDDIPDGRYANLIKVAKYEAAQEQAFSISQRSTQGAQLALEDGRNVTSAHTPYGCWRFYLTADGRPSHIIADLRDGRQQKLHPTTFEVVDNYGEIGGKSKGHYRKQKTEKVLLRQGFAEEVAVVREIFDLHFRQGWGGRRIANLLNRRGIRSPQGRQWSQHQVEVIYEQEVYTGRSVGNRTSSAIYHERHASAPKRVELDPSVQATAKLIPVRHRPLGEWFVQDQPLMEHFLDPELRKIAMAAHEKLWAERGDVDRPKRSKSKHQASDYLLTGLLFAKQDGESLVGTLCGRVGRKVRYYRHRRGRRGCVEGSVYNRMVPAKPLEDAVVEIVRQILTSDAGLRDRVVAFVESEARKTEPSEELSGLRAKRDQVKKRTGMIVSTLDEETLADAKDELERLKAERRSVEAQIAAAEASAALRSLDPQAVADDVVGKLTNLAATVGEMPKFALRQFLASVVGRVEVDMQTKAAEVQLMLPIEMVYGENFSGGSMRLVGTSASSTSYETHRVLTLQLAEADCRYTLSSSKACYECRRRSAA